MSFQELVAQQLEAVFANGTIRDFLFRRVGEVDVPFIGVVDAYPARLSGVCPGDLRVTLRAGGLAGVADPGSSDCIVDPLTGAVYDAISVLDEGNGIGPVFQLRRRSGTLSGLEFVSANRIQVMLGTDIYETMSVWAHARGDNEISGNVTYAGSPSVTGVGFYEHFTTPVTFDSLRCSVSCKNVNRDVTLKIYLRDELVPVFSTGGVTPDYVATIPAAAFPHQPGVISSFALSVPLTVPANKTLCVVFSSGNNNEMQLAYWNADAVTAPGRHSFLLESSSTGNTVTSATASGFWGATFQLFLNQDISRAQVTAYQHVRGDAEMVGDSVYGHATYGRILGFYEQMVQDTVFDTVQAYVANLNLNSTVTLYIYERDTAAMFTPSSVAALATVTLSPGMIPHVMGQATIPLGKQVTVRPGKYVFLLFSNEGQTSADLQIARWTSDSGTSPSRHGFIYGNSYSSNTLLGTVNNFQTAFRLLNHQSIPVGLDKAIANLPACLSNFDNSGTGMKSRRVQDAIVEAFNTAKAGSQPVPRIVLPDEVTAVVGDKLQVFTRSVVEAPNPYAVAMEFSCPIGAGYPRYFELTPTSAGNQVLAVNALDYSANVIASGQTTLRVVASTGQPAVARNVLCVGDSLTAGGQWPQEFYRRVAQSGGTPAGLGYGNVAFIGNTAMASYPVQKFVGYGGWSWDNFLGTTPNTAAWVACSGHGKDASDQKSVYKDSTQNQWQIETIQSSQIKMIPYGGATGYSMPGPTGTLTWVSGGTHAAAINYTSVTPDASTPFWNGSAFSFSGFCSANGITGIDVIYVLLGWNGLAGPNAANALDHATAIAKARTFLNRFHADYPSAVARLVGIQLPSLNGGLAANYGATGAFSSVYKLVRSVNGLRMAYQALANESAYSGWVRYLDVACQFDSENNMQQADTTVNSRNTATEKRGTNGVHPDITGYNQIADAVWRDFVRSFCSN